MANPITLLFGYRKIRAKLSDAADIFNICGKYGIVYRNQKSADKEKYIELECSLPAAKRLSQCCAEQGIELISLTTHGTPLLLKKYKRRYGLFVGLILSVILIFMSGRTIWDIRIEGRLDRLTKSEGTDLLRECGLRIGTAKKRLNKKSKIQTWE